MSIEEEAARLLEAGKKALDSHDYDKALKHLSMSLSYSRNAEAHLLKAKAFLRKNDLRETLREAEYGVTICGDSEFELRDECNKIIEMANAKLHEQQESIIQFREEIAKHKEGAIKGSAARAFAEETKLSSLRLRPVFNNESRSQFKGHPLVPEDFVWPLRADGTKLAFLVQIDLEEAAKYSNIADQLPTDGLLSFFYDIDQQPWGSSIIDKDGWRVFHFSKKTELKPYLDENISSEQHFSVDYLEETSYPDNGSDEFFTLPEAVKTEYDTFLENCFEESPMHRLLGHPHLIQNDFRESIEIVTKAIQYETLRGNAEKTKKLFEDSRRWRTLLQIDSDDELGFCWGDSGILYFCIDEKALKKHDFSDVWVELQSY